MAPCHYCVSAQSTQFSPTHSLPPAAASEAVPTPPSPRTGTVLCSTPSPTPYGATASVAFHAHHRIRWWRQRRVGRRVPRQRWRGRYVIDAASCRRVGARASGSVLVRLWLSPAHPPRVVFRVQAAGHHSQTQGWTASSHRIRGEAERMCDADRSSDSLQWATRWSKGSLHTRRTATTAVHPSILRLPPPALPSHPTSAPHCPDIYASVHTPSPSTRCLLGTKPAP